MSIAINPFNTVHKGGISVKDVDQANFVLKLSEYLKKIGKIKVPEFAEYVKTGVHKELCPENPDWWYIRIASTARQLYMSKSIGVGKFRKIFGGRKRRGSRPTHFSKSSGNIARKVLQQLEELKLAEINKKDGGRSLTKEGRKVLDRIAYQMKNDDPVIRA